MFLTVPTYKNDKLYVILGEIYGICDDAQAKLDLKNIAIENNIVNSVWALELLSFRLRQLCESIWSCDDHYSVCVLYRAFIEHFIKHAYIFFSCIKTGDDVGKQYVSSEHMSYEIWLRLHKSRWPDTGETEVTDSKRGEFKDFKKRAKQTLNQFAFGEVAKALLGVLDAADSDKTKKALREAIVGYSKLSSYVHAGPLVVLDLQEKSKENIEMDSTILTMIAYKGTIELLSKCPSLNQEALRAVRATIHEKADRAMAIYDERMLHRRNAEEREESAEEQNR